MQTYSTFKKLFFFIVFFVPIICFSQSNSIKEGFVKTDNPLKTSLDSLVNESVRLYFKDTKAVGVSIGIVLNGENFYYNYGQMENGKSVLPTNKTLYELGSMTKTFTGILLAQGVLDKKINLNDDIRKYLNEQYPNLEYRGAPAKIVHLSNHTSGITRIFPNLWERKEYDSLNPYANYTKKLLFEGLHNMKMDAELNIVTLTWLWDYWVIL